MGVNSKVVKCDIHKRQHPLGADVYPEVGPPGHAERTKNRRLGTIFILTGGGTRRLGDLIKGTADAAAY